MKKKIVITIGTRPEAIKLIPLYLELKKTRHIVLLCSTGQHREMLTNIYSFFNIVPDINFDIMKPNQDLFYITCQIICKVKEFYNEIKPDLVIVQGDTTSAFACALGAFYMRIPIAHVEAGLRTGNKMSPFPEEVNRKFISTIATYHFAPTMLNAANLISEGICRESVFCTGNTVIDSLTYVKKRINKKNIELSDCVLKKIEFCNKNYKKKILLTIHRRESFGKSLGEIFLAIKKVLNNFNDIFIFYPRHPNPSVEQVTQKTGLQLLENIFLINPLDYHDFINLLSSVDFVITDSGGIQEEAIFLGKSVLVIRDSLERIEGLLEGNMILCEPEMNRIYECIIRLYKNTGCVNTCNKENFMFGDGKASHRISLILDRILQNQDLENRIILRALDYQKVKILNKFSLSLS